MKNPTIVDIAKRASVSVGTASNVMNRRPVVSKALVERVEAAAAELGYNRNTLAASLRSSRTGVIALVVPNIENAFFSEVLQEIENLALDSEKSVMFMTTGEDEARTRRHLQAIISRRVDGLIIVPAFDYQPALAELERYGIPIVVADRISQKNPFPSVSVDHKAAGEMAGRHLLEIGARDVVYFGHSRPDYWILKQREDGFSAALANQPEQVSVRSFSMSLDVFVGKEQALTALKALDKPPQAIFAASNLASKSVLPALQAKGWSIPGDTRFLAMDDFEALTMMQPGISVISQPSAQIASQAWQKLMHLIDGEEAGENALLQPELIVRGSTPVIAASA